MLPVYHFKWESVREGRAMSSVIDIYFFRMISEWFDYQDDVTFGTRNKNVTGMERQLWFQLRFPLPTVLKKIVIHQTFYCLIEKFLVDIIFVDMDLWSRFR